MGAVSRAITENPTSEEIDDGWSLEGEGLPLALRSIPQETTNASIFAEEDLAGGWFLADEEAKVVPAVRTNSTLLNPLTDEELEFFSRAELAMGTEVDFPVPDEAWFDDLRCIVPRKRPVSVSDTGLDLKRPEPTSAKSAAAQAASVQTAHVQTAALEVEDHELPAALSSAPKKASWWKRLRRSKN